MKLPLYLTTLVLATLACNACDDRPPPDGRSPALEAVVRDSADVRIVENPRPPSQSRLAWQVSTEPAVSIGTLEGEEPYLLHRVQDALILPDGRIVVANSGSNELRVFDASGMGITYQSNQAESASRSSTPLQIQRRCATTHQQYWNEPADQVSWSVLLFTRLQVFPLPILLRLTEQQRPRHILRCIRDRFGHMFFYWTPTGAFLLFF